MLCCVEWAARRIGRRITSVLFAFAIFAPALPAQPTTALGSAAADTVRLRTRWFCGYGFAVGSDRERCVVEPLFGFGLTRQFREALSRDSVALAEARRAEPFLALSAASTLVSIVISVAYLSKVLNAEFGESVDPPIIPWVASFGGGLVMRILAMQHIQESVEIYNTNVTRVAAPTRGEFAHLVRARDLPARTLQVGLRFRFN